MTKATFRLLFCAFLLAQIKVLESFNRLAKYCDNMDLSTFCIIGNHFRQVNYDENRKMMRFPEHKHFQKIVENFYPPIWDVNKDGIVEPWPWIQDNWDDTVYSLGIPELMVQARDIIGVQEPKNSAQLPLPQKSGIFVQGYRFNLYSVFDLCALDKIYSPVYRLYSKDNEIPRPKVVPSSAAVASNINDYRLHYSCGGEAYFNVFGVVPPAGPSLVTTPCDPPLFTAKKTSPWAAQQVYEFGLENPFDVKVTEIKVNGRRLHNHLHFEIGFKDGVLDPTLASRTTKGAPNLPPTQTPTGPTPPTPPDPIDPKPIDKRISYAFIIVHDQDGAAIGDFNTGIPCGECLGKCKGDKTLLDRCHQGQGRDAIPCMFVSDNAVTHPGQIMMHFEDPVSTIHVTWRFAQSTSPSAFSREIHVKTLLVLEGAENEPMVMVRDGRVEYRKSNLEKIYKYYDCFDPNFKDSFEKADPNLAKPGTTSGPTSPVQSNHCYRHSPKYGVFGWNAKYPILYPTEKTIGGWDYFPARFIHTDALDCHVALNKDYYAVDKYPIYGLAKLPETPGIKPVAGDVLPKWIIKPDEGPNFIMGSKSEVYQGLTLEQPRYYRGLIDEKSLTLINRRVLEEQKYVPKDRSIKDRNLHKIYETTKHNLRRLKRLEDMQEAERCHCARFGTVAPPPGDKVPPIGQLEGRRDHAIQMTIAWIALVPFGIFVSRYYKETYSKVFFLQEFWWYTIHVLTFLLAAVFNVGGIYAIEIKRSEAFNLLDTKQFIHAAIGASSILIFTMHLILGVFRLKSPKRRRIQIFFHWFFGFFNYLAAIGCMITAAFVKSGCMGCETLYLLLSWVGIQIIMYIIMEIHIRLSDKQMHLNPKRSYLPPPTMRIFHKNAPGAKFRIIMLVVFGCFSTGFYAAMHYTIESGKPAAFRSCFVFDLELEAIQEQYIKLVD